MRVIVGQPARQLLVESLLPMARAIAAGIGPDGRACLAGEGNRVDRLATGAEIARRIGDGQGAGALAPHMLREALVTAERDLGDGTSRIALLATAMFREATRAVAGGIGPHALADALLAEVELFNRVLRERRLDTPSIAAVCRSAGVAEDLAGRIAELAEGLGPGGSLEVVDGREPGVTTVTGEGFVFDAEPVSAALQPVPLDPVYLLVANEIVDDLAFLLPVLEGFATRGRALLIVARDVTGPALQTLVHNRLKSVLRVAALKPAAAGEEAAETLQDLAVATGATLICSSEGTALSAVRPAMLGRADGFSFAAGRARLTGPAGAAEAVSGRQRLLAAEAERKRYLSLDRERLLRRAGRLVGRWGELRIGGKNERETAGLVASARRAAASARSALDGGVIAGGAHGLAVALADAGDATSPKGAAVRCLQSGVAALHRAIAANGGAPLSIADAPAVIAGLRGIEPDPKVQDPLSLTTSILSRAASLAAVLVRADTLLCSR
jgi:chaperonin GroEL (HSP60 family)